MKLKILIIIVLVFLLAGLVYSQPVDDPRPVPPTIHTYGFPPVPGQTYFPAECYGQNGCGVLCYYIDEGGGNYELSCLPFIFE